MDIKVGDIVKDAKELQGKDIYGVVTKVVTIKHSFNLNSVTQYYINWFFTDEQYNQKKVPPIFYFYFDELLKVSQ
jgi:hypothetical protein